MSTRGWKEIKDEVYGKKGTSRRDELEREFESLKIGLLLKKALNSGTTRGIGR